MKINKIGGMSVCSVSVCFLLVHNHSRNVPG